MSDNSWRTICVIVAMTLSVLLSALMGLWLYTGSMDIIALSRLSPLARTSPLALRSQGVTGTLVLDDNLLANPSFEGEYTCQDNKCTAPAWAAWWITDTCRPLTPGCELPCPSNCIKEQSSSIVSGTDGIVTMQPTTLTVGVPSRLTITLMTTKPLQAAEVFVFVNPAVMTVTAGALDEYSSVRWARGVTRYYRDTPTGTMGIVPLMALTVTPEMTDVVNFEVVYWLWTPEGGEHPGQWAGRESQPSRLSVRAAAGKPRCVADTGCYWAVPEFKPTDRPERVHGGGRAQQWFTYGRMGEGGVRQTVAVTLGAWYRFSAWMQAWQCYDWLTCCDKRPTCISDAPYVMNLQAGIAVTDSVAWGLAGESFDTWTQFSALAQAVTDTLTVSVRSRARFDYARENNDVYLDDARMEEVHVLWVPLVEVTHE